MAGRTRQAAHPARITEAQLWALTQAVRHRIYIRALQGVPWAIRAWRAIAGESANVERAMRRK
jgi:hypothetical protein